MTVWHVAARSTRLPAAAPPALSSATMVIVDTCTGPEAIAYAQCRVCGWSGWGTIDLDIVFLPDGSFEHDEETEDPCPNCGIRHELSIVIDDDELRRMAEEAMAKAGTRSEGAPRIATHEELRRMANEERAKKGMPQVPLDAPPLYLQ